MSNSEVLQCSEEQRAAILKFHNASSEDVHNGVQRLKEWMKSQPHFTEVMDDVFLEKMFVINKGNMERIKHKLTMYYVIRHSMPEIFSHNPNSPEALRHMDSFYYCPLPKLTADYNRIIMITVGDDTTDNFDPHIMVMLMLSIIEIRIREDHRCKDIHIYDLKNVKFSQMAKLFAPTLVNKVRCIVDNLFDTSIIRIHYVNIPSYLESFINLMKTFMKHKIEQRIIIHKDLNSLYDEVGRENLPEEYGGNNCSLDNIRNLWKKKLLEYNPVFDRLANIKVNMDLLPDKIKIDDAFGVFGNFRKLEVD